MLKAFLKTLDGLDESLRGLYAEVEGGFVLQVEPTSGYALENISGLKTTLEKLKSERDTFKARVKAFMLDDEEISPDEAIRALKENKELRAIDPEKLADEKIRSTIEELTRKHEKALKALESEADEVRSQLQTVLIDQAATVAISEAKGSVNLLLPHVKSQTKLVKENGEYRVQVVGQDGNTRLHVENGRTSDMTLPQLVAEMAQNETFMPAFQADATKPGTNQESTDSDLVIAKDSVHVDDLNRLAASGDDDPISRIADGELAVLD